MAVPLQMAEGSRKESRRMLSWQVCDWWQHGEAGLAGQGDHDGP